MTVRGSHHLLATPIDWKLGACINSNKLAMGRHLLVTPIDWKLVDGHQHVPLEPGGHHLLVTPIDWKLLGDGVQLAQNGFLITTCW